MKPSELKGFSKILLAESNSSKEVSAVFVFELALMRNEDVILVSKSNGIAVVKILDFGKEQYITKKTQKEKKDRIKKSDHKYIQFKPAIAQKDFFRKVQMASNFLDQGHCVSLKVFMKGRQNCHPELAQDVLNKAIECLQKEHQVVFLELPKQKGSFVATKIQLA